MTYLAAVALGPVQDFIAAARRCRDLWYGSRLLSELSKSAALALYDRGARLIFPAPNNREDLLKNTPFTVANKLLVSVETGDIRDLVQQVKIAVQNRLEESAELRSMKLRGLVVKEEIYWQQLRQFIEFYAAWVPQEGYASSRARVEELLAARKTLRDFTAYRGGEGEYKSSLDGAREHVIQKRSNRLYESNLKINEYLDAIGIVKRFGGNSPRFDSTVDVAALPFIEGIGKSSEKRKDAFRRYERFIRDNRLPPQTYSLLYEHESRQIFEDDEASSKELQQIRDALGKPTPPYFALLQGDGDRMGRAISKIGNAEEHAEFSRDLSGFAAQAREMIDGREFNGCSIYCGGDDVLALLPLHKALQCAQSVNQLFRRSMQAYDVTFSAGLIVAHGLEPLTEVRAWAADAEHTAKTVGGRDSLCISVNPRSGSPISVHGKWGEIDNVLEKIAELYDQIPRGLSYELRDLLERLDGWHEMDPVLPKLVLAVAKKKDCKPEAVEFIQGHSSDRASIARLYRSLIIAKWFARAEREAAGDATNHPN